MVTAIWFNRYFRYEQLGADSMGSSRDRAGRRSVRAVVSSDTGKESSVYQGKGAPSVVTFSVRMNIAFLY
jgi:hypothetical protein